MPNNKTARRDYIDIMKGLGILLVVLGHFMEQFRFGFKPIGATFICIYLFHMALFCICSGLVAHFSLWKLITQQVWLYAVGQAIMLAFRAVILREDFAASGGLLLAFLLPWRHMWYLYALIFWHLTLPLLTHLRDKGLPFVLLGLAGAVALGLWAGNVDWPFTLVRVFAYYPFYAFGVLFRPQIDRLDDLAATSPVMRLAPAGALVVCYGLYFRSLMLQEGQLRESAKIFNDVAYGEGYGHARPGTVLRHRYCDQPGADRRPGRMQGLCRPRQKDAGGLSFPYADFCVLQRAGLFPARPRKAAAGHGSICAAGGLGLRLPAGQRTGEQDI